MVSKLSKGWKLFLGATTVTIVTVAAFVIFNRVENDDFEQKVAQAKSYDFPFEGRDLVPEFDYTEEQNGAQYIVDLQAVKNGISFSEQLRGFELVSHAIKGELTDAEWATAETYIQEFEPVLTRLEQAAGSPYCYFEKDWDLGMSVMFPELAPIKNSVKPMLARARLRLMRGDIEGAKGDLETVQAIAQHVGEQPHLIALLVSLALDSMVLRLVQVVLPEAAKSEEAANMLKEIVEQSPDSWNHLPQLRGEAFFTFWATDKLGEFSEIYNYWEMDDEELKELYVEGLKPGAVRKLQTTVIDVYGQAIENYTPEQNERELYSGMRERLEKAKKESRLTKLFFEMLGSSYDQLPDTLDRHRANKQCLLAALDALSLYRVTSRIPDGEAKGISGFIDPFDGQELRYRRDGNGFRIWSIGRDLEDNNGTTRDEDKDAYDEVVVYPPILEPFEEIDYGVLPMPPNAVGAP